jgi:tetratricopeptide (TPR) repeat protein
MVVLVLVLIIKQIMRPKELLYAHKYVEAVEAYKHDIREHPDKNYYSALGQSLLALGNYEEALNSFRRDDKIENSRIKGCFPSLIKAATALWLLGKRLEAVQEWHRAVAGILDGSIRFGDASGGGTQGLLLWYGAVTLGDSSEREYALDFLRSIKRRKLSTSAICWPHPIVQMVLGEMPIAKTLTICCHSSVLSECLKEASTDLLKRRGLCQILFYNACCERSFGNEVECIRKMRLCLQLENPIIECEWYLARNEVNSMRQP